MAARLHPDEDSPFGRPFSTSDHSRGGGGGGPPAGTAASSSSSSSSTAAQSPSSSSTPLPAGIRPGVLNRFEGGAEEINAAVLLPGEEQVGWLIK